MAENQLRIAMLSVHSCPVGTLGTRDTGGMSVYIVELASALGKLGYLVDVYTRVHDPRDRQIYALGRDVQLIHLKAGEDEQINKLAVYSYLPDFACGIEAFRKENNLQYDLVFSHYWLSAWVGKYLEQWWHVPHITMFHTLGAVKNSFGIGEDEHELRIEMERDLSRRERGRVDNKIILLVGRIEPLKGIDQLLKAIPYLPDTQGVRLVI